MRERKGRGEKGVATAHALTLLGFGWEKRGM